MGCLQSKAAGIDVPPTLPVANPSAAAAARTATPAPTPTPPVMVSSATTSSRPSNPPQPTRRTTHSGKATSYGSTVHHSGTVPSPPPPLIASGATSGVHPHEVPKYGFQTPPVLSPTETATFVPSPSPPAHDIAQRVTGTTAHLPPKSSAGAPENWQLDPDGTSVVLDGDRSDHRRFTPTVRKDNPRYASRHFLVNVNVTIVLQIQNSRRWQGAW